ncbi:MAG TPA: rod shape-determining protein MreD [Candidatus Omnitrophota bacterium]|nr:hypothetical protein [Candidatus Omnitrophota bacterium]HRK61652.1 rod shape-determining protein MreD [Candidatus Omnitrophota bacterium]
MLGSLRFKIVFLFLSLLALDLCFAPVVQISGARPVFSFLLVAYAVFQWDSRRVFPIVVAVGLSRDIFGGGVFGVELLAFVCWTYLLDGVAHKIEREFPGIYFALTAIFCFFVLLTAFIVDSLLGNVAWLTGAHLKVLLMTSFYTALFLPLFYQIADFLFKPHAELRQYELFRS